MPSTQEAHLQPPPRQIEALAVLMERASSLGMAFLPLRDAIVAGEADALEFSTLAEFAALFGAYSEALIWALHTGALGDTEIWTHEMLNGMGQHRLVDMRLSADDAIPALNQVIKRASQIVRTGANHVPAKEKSTNAEALREQLHLSIKLLNAAVKYCQVDGSEIDRGVQLQRDQMRKFMQHGSPFPPVAPPAAADHPPRPASPAPSMA